MRTAEVYRKTKETEIRIELNLDGSGRLEGSSGIGFMDHMLDAFARHSRIDLRLSCIGDLAVDGHHTVEDIGIVLGTAIKQALGDGRGINRYGHSILPMDEALLCVAMDLSGRSYMQYDVSIPAEKVGDFDTELAKEFFYAFARCAQMTLHIKQLAGENSHHILEAIFKAFARALRQACCIDPEMAQEVPSTKGSL